MNARILGNAMAVQRQNDQKVVSRAHAKAQREWKNLVVVTKQCPPFPKPGLVKLASEQLLKVLGLNAWGVRSVPRDVASRMEKDEDFTRDDSIHPLCICTTIEDGMGCKKLGSRVQ
jgi:hypothetical protein